jgi:hypothetical protein
MLLSFWCSSSSFSSKFGGKCVEFHEAAREHFLFVLAVTTHFLGDYYSLLISILSSIHVKGACRIIGNISCCSQGKLRFSAVVSPCWSRPCLLHEAVARKACPSLNGSMISLTAHVSA